MLNKLHKTHGDNINYLKPKSDMNASFGMNHFAGVVFYDARGMHVLRPDVLRPELFHSSPEFTPRMSSQLVTGLVSCSGADHNCFTAWNAEVSPFR